MEIEVHKSEDNNQINLTLMISLAREYSKALEQELTDNNEDTFQEPKYVSNVETNCTESTCMFLNKLVKLNNLLVVADTTKRDRIDDFMTRLSDGIFSMVFPEKMICLDLRPDSVFQYNNKFLNARITDMEDCFSFLEERLTEDDCLNEQYIIINECVDFFFEDCNKFVNLIKRLLENPKNHIICISSETALLTEQLLSCFNNRVSFWVGSTKASKLIYAGKNIGCNSLLTGECHFTEDFGETVTKEYMDTFGQDMYDLLDI